MHMRNKMYACKPLAWQRIEERSNRTSTTARRAKNIHTLTTHKRPVLAVAFSNSHLITCSADGTAQVFERESSQLTLTYAGHASDILSCQLLEDLSPSDQNVIGRDLILTASRDCSAKAWNYKTGETIRSLSHAGSVRSAMYSGGFVVSHSGRSTISFWNLADETLLFQHDDLFAMASPLAVQLPYIAFGTFGKMWYLCEVGLDKQLSVKKVAGHERAVLAVAIDKQGSRVLTGGEDRQAVLYELASGSILHRLNGHMEPILDVCFSPWRADVAMSCAADKTARIWDLSTGACTLILHAFDSVRCGVIKGGFALVGCNDNSAMLFDISEGAYRRLLLLCKGARSRQSFLKRLPLDILKNIKGFLV